MTNQHTKMPQIEKLPLTSMDIKDSQIHKLKELFPEIFTDGNKIDWEKLKLTLGENVDTGKERFGMNWPGKADCFKTIQQPSIATLVPDREESIDFDNTQNLFIEGDNLEVLKLLQKSYLGKIKMIYIDPPYNTGNEFVYPDDYSENLSTYLEYTGQKNNEGRKFATNAETDGRFHSKWLNMMYPRLFLARNLLKEDGIIFISIDDNELNHLKTLCNEIFGSENFIGVFVWKRRQNADSRNQTNVSADHEYIVSFAKSSEVRFLGRKIDITKYTNPDNDPRGSWASIDLSGLATKDQRPNLHYDIVDPKTGISYPPNPKRGWSKSKLVIDKMIEDGKILFPRSPNGRPREKKFLNEIQKDTTGFSTWLDSEEVGFTTNGTREVSEILEGKYFDFPKPSALIQKFIEQVTSDGDIVLDFFAGSCTTANAVLNENYGDKQNRRFICVQLPEPTGENTEAYKSGYRNISEIGKERIRRVIKNISEESSQQIKDGELFLFNSGETRKIDLGFRVFNLQSSNFKLWDASIEKNQDAIQTALDLHVNHLSPAAQQEGILYEILLKSGFELTASIEKLEIEGKMVYSIADGELLICLEKSLTQELIKAIAERQPTRVICLDEGFQNNDQLKTNAVQIMKSKNVVSFRTV